MPSFNENIEILIQYLGKDADDEILSQITDISDQHEYLIEHKKEEIKELENRIAELEPLEIFQRWEPLQNIVVDAQLDRLFSILDRIPTADLDFFLDEHDPMTRNAWILKQLT